MVVSAKNISRHLFFLLFVGLHALSLPAQTGDARQIRARAEPSKILLGEPFRFSVQITQPVNGKNKLSIALPDSFAHFDVLGAPESDSTDSAGIITVTHTVKLTSFDSGRWVIPAIQVSSGKQAVSSNPVEVDVLTVPLQGNTYREIHDIIEVPEVPLNWKLWAAIGATVLLLALGIWNYLRKRNKPAPQPLAYDSKLSPFDQAMQSLAAVKTAGYMAKGDPVNHYTGITDALRIYLVRKFGIPVMAETTGEILSRMQDLNPSREQLSAVASCLRMADAVKFARYIPDASDAAASLDDISTFIKWLDNQKA